MAIDDVTDACGILRPVHDASGGADGFVSLEVSPVLASDTDGTIEAARGLHERIAPAEPDGQDPRHRRRRARPSGR